MERPCHRLRFCCPFVVRNAAEHVAGRRNATRLIVAHTKGGHHADAAAERTAWEAETVSNRRRGAPA